MLSRSEVFDKKNTHALRAYVQLLSKSEDENKLTLFCFLWHKGLEIYLSRYKRNRFFGSVCSQFLSSYLIFIDLGSYKSYKMRHWEQRYLEAILFPNALKKLIAAPVIRDYEHWLKPPLLGT